MSTNSPLSAYEPRQDMPHTDLFGSSRTALHYSRTADFVTNNRPVGAISTLASERGTSTAVHAREKRGNSLEEMVYLARANAKIAVSRIAMFLSGEQRLTLFRKIDEFHDLDEWDTGDTPLSEGSFADYLRAMFVLKPKNDPSLGMSSKGHLLCAWISGRDRLSFEFLGSGRVRWVLSRTSDGQTETAAGEASIARVKAVLAPYDPEIWLN